MDASSEIYLFPYLQIKEAIGFGPWMLEPADSKSLTRQKNPLSQNLFRVFGRHLGHDGRPVSSAVVARRIDAEPVDAEGLKNEIEALQTAVTFSAIDANARKGNVIDWDSGSLDLATTETTILSVTPLAALTGGASTKRGGPINSRLVGGRSSLLVHAAPEGLISSPVLSLDQQLADAVFKNALVVSTEPEAIVERQIHAALHWHARAWENSPLHTMPDIIVQLKTSLEALSGKHKTQDGVGPLRELYKGASDSHGADNLLWTKQERMFERTVPGKTFQVAAFDHWYWNLAETRNNIVHETLDPQMDYETDGSPFNGNLFQVADRVCRELIKVRLSMQGYHDLLMSRSDRSMMDVMRRAGLAPAMSK